MKPIERIIAAWFISSGPETNPRMLQWIKPESGWAGFVKTYVEPVLSQGIKRIWLHGPFGREGMRTLKFSDGASGPSNYRLDEYLCSKHAGLEWNYEGFVETFKPLTKAGIEVIAYLGTAEGQPEFEDMNKYAQKKFFQRLTDSLAPILDSGCSLSIDSSSRASSGSWLLNHMSTLKARGIRVIVEAIPTLKNTELHKWDMVCCDTHWPNVVNNPQIYPKVEDLGGEVVRMICSGKPAQYATHKEWYLDVIPKTLAEGAKYSIAANLSHFLNAGGKIQELVDKIK